MKTSLLKQKKLPLVVELDGGKGSGSTAAAFVDLFLRERDLLQGQLLAVGALLLRGSLWLPLPNSRTSSARFQASACLIMLAAQTVAWRAGDVLILDNLLAAHGRMPFTGKRKVLLAMT
jgi:hypothetical protein